MADYAYPLLVQLAQAQLLNDPLYTGVCALRPQGRQRPAPSGVPCGVRPAALACIGTACAGAGLPPGH